MPTRASLKWALLAPGVALAILAFAILWPAEERRPPTAPPAPLEMSFDGDSSLLARTQIVPTLDTPVASGSNVIWCASFVSAWKSLETLAAGPIQLAGAQQDADALNAAADPAAYVPEASIYSAAGWVDKGIIQTIKQEMKRRFPAAPEPVFEAGPNDIAAVAYAYLEANAQFALAFMDNPKPLAFADSAGTRVPVRSFGIRAEDSGSCQVLRQQVKVLYYLPYAGKDGSRDHVEFALDLCRTSQPNQVVVARVPWQNSLAATLDRVSADINPDAADAAELYEDDVLLVPDIFWRVSHHFANLEGRFFANPAFQGLPLLAAKQDVTFRLDRRGAEVKSEAKIILGAIPTVYVLDRPFLVYMKKRGSDQPFFVMWVDNAELLQKW